MNTGGTDDDAARDNPKRLMSEGEAQPEKHEQREQQQK
jgi:hypothetical protein